MPARVRGPSPRKLAHLRWNSAEVAGTGIAAPMQVLVSSAVWPGRHAVAGQLRRAADGSALTLEVFGRTQAGTETVLLDG